MIRIFASLSARTLGDYVGYAVIASSIKERFDDAELFVYIRDDRAYKPHVARCIRNARAVLSMPVGGGSIPIDFFDSHAGRPSLDSKFWEDSSLHLTDIVLAGNMMREGMLNAMPSTTLAPPPETVAPSDAALASHGLDPSKWIATVYWKEDGYAHRGFNPIRTITDPTPYLALIRYIVEQLGGQVVRLGHPTPTELPKLPGVVDLAKVQGSEWLQMYAVARSRFFIASSSGPAAYGPAFGVPTANTDQNLCYGVWGANDYVLTQGIMTADQRWYRQTEAFDAGLLYLETDLKTFRKLSRNTAQDLCHAADEMMRVSADCTGWREFKVREVTGPRPNSVTFPLPFRYRRELLIPPSQR